MDGIVGPDGRPATFDGAAWISQDGRYWWNGTVWQPVKRSRSLRPNWFVIAMAVIIVGVVAVFFTQVHHDAVSPDKIPLGVSNARIDSPTQVQFDYSTATACNGLTFRAVFYDKTGKQVQVFDNSTVASAPAHKLVHFTVSVSPPIVASAVRFDAIPTCHS